MTPRRQLTHGLIIGASLALAALWLVFGTESPGSEGTPRTRAPESRPAAAASPLWRLFTASNALGDAAYLSWEIGPRPGGSAAECRAATYLARRLRDLGYAVSAQRGIAMDRPGMTTANIIGLEPNAGHKPRIVLGAHYDTVSGAVAGANDNASGVAVVLELARLLVQRPAPYALQIVLFGAEERRSTGGSLTGSRHFVAHSPEPVAAMVNVDMVGCGTDLHVWRSGARGRYLADLFARSAAALSLPLDADGASPNSDHASFARAGVPAVWLQSLPDPRNHTPRDRVEELSAVSLQRAGRLLLHTLTSIEAEDLRLLQKRCPGPPQAVPRTGR